jgi:predicted DNA-binding protein YlxM (UPF0122 family)
MSSQVSEQKQQRGKSAEVSTIAKEPSSTLVAVLTSDIVHSTKLEKADYSIIMGELDSQLKSISSETEAKYEIFRGDSFQVLFPRPSDAMKYTLALRMFLQAGFSSKSVELTQSLAINHFEHLGESPGTSSGPAFVMSGRTLDKANRGDFLLNILNTEKGGISKSDMSLSTMFLNHMLKGLTEKQAGVIYHYLILGFPEQKVIAEKLGITRQNVATHLKRGGADLIKAYLTSYESLCHRTDTSNGDKK